MRIFWDLQCSGVHSYLAELNIQNAPFVFGDTFQVPLDLFFLPKTGHFS